MQCNLLYYDSFWLVGGFFKELPLKCELVVANNRTYTCEWIAQVGEFWSVKRFSKKSAGDQMS